jgi:hypothetical protein
MNRPVAMKSAGVLFLAVAVNVATALVAAACPFCSAPSLTLTEQLTQADAAVLGEWVGGTAAEGDNPGATEYQIREVVHQPKGQQLKVGETLSLVRFRPAKKGDLFLLLGTKGGAVLDWGSPLQVTQESFEYMREAPRPDVKPTERLRYFIKFLEHSDQMIATDAYGEFANTAYGDITPLSPEMPREQLRKWVADDQTPPARLGLYGLMLGLCGTADDVSIFEARIFAPTEDFRLGIDGVMGGYLLLTTEKGLARLEQDKIQNSKAPFSETYAAMQALRFLWQYGDGKVSADRLRQSMRLLLDRPELADLVIADLARWKDWSLVDRLQTLYHDEAYQVPSIKRAIVRYYLTCSKQVVAESGAATPEAQQAAAHLAALEKSDPKIVSEAKRFFFVKD